MNATAGDGGGAEQKQINPAELRLPRLHADYHPALTGGLQIEPD
jgi:hypothetical protein